MNQIFLREWNMSLTWKESNLQRVYFVVTVYQHWNDYTHQTCMIQWFNAPLHVPITHPILSLLLIPFHSWQLINVTWFWVFLRPSLFKTKTYCHERVYEKDILMNPMVGQRSRFSVWWCHDQANTVTVSSISSMGGTMLPLTLSGVVG